MLVQYYDEVQTGDKTNREAHAAKVYLMLCLVMNFLEKMILR